MNEFSDIDGDHIDNRCHLITRPLCEPDNLWRGNDTGRGRWRAA